MGGVALIATLPSPDDDIVVTFTTEELTMFGARDQPDFGTLTIEYRPAGRIAELKSLKKYVQSFRDRLFSYERLVSTIHREFHDAVQPAWVRVSITFRPRGGTVTSVSKHG